MKNKQMNKPNSDSINAKKNFFFDSAGTMRRFLGQELNPYHSSDLSHSSDNAGSFNH